VPATPRETSVLEYEVRVAARPETIFSYFTDPSKMVQWMGAQAMLDPRPGGVCRIVFQTPETRADSIRAEFGADEVPEGADPNVGVMAGKFVEVDPPRRIVLTWGWEQKLFAVPPQSTEVEVTFTGEGAETIVHIAHRRLPAHAVAFHRVGWEHYFPRLAIAAAGGVPGPDPWQLTGQAD
jgi:uncharacterized protein YndB with AHSA1/START domain